MAGQDDALWNGLPVDAGLTFSWADDSTYIRKPPFFDGFSMEPEAPPPIRGARALAVFGDFLTTDHISPGGRIGADSPAGRYLLAHDVGIADFNSYIARRGNHDVMIRGTFANVRIRNLLTPGELGGVSIHQPDGERASIYEVAARYARENVPLIIVAGQEYGTGSSRDWAAKGTILLGVKAILAKSFERIHRSNLIGMGVLPCQFDADFDVGSLALTGAETFDILGIEHGVSPRQMACVRMHADGQTKDIPVMIRIDTSIEAQYYLAGGVLPYVLRSMLQQAT